ncbi:MAG: ABC transporter permease [Candidatus Caldarchaeales archaeon]
MRLLDIILLAFSALRDRKLRTILTILGMVVGPATYVAVISSTEGISESITSGLKNFGAEKIFVMRSGRSTVDITDRDAESVSKIQGVKHVIPFYAISSGYAKSKGMTIELSPLETYSILAVDLKDIDKIFPGIKLKEGVIPLRGDNVAVIGLKVSEPDSKDLPRIYIGDAVTIARGSFTGEFKSHSVIVKGVLDYYGQSFFYNPDLLIFVSRDVGRKLTESKSYTGMFIVAEDPSLVDYIEQTLIELYGGEFIVISTKSVLRTVQSITSMLTIFLVSVASMSLIVAFLAIMATMFTAVTERIREIGILKALGFKTRDVLFIFLTEAALIGLIGGVLGAAVGAAGAYILAQPSSIEQEASGNVSHFRGQMGFSEVNISYIPKITPELILTAIGIAFLVGVFAGIIPAWRAAKYTPVEAIRKE